jgi:hypothetical protein
VRVGAVPGVGLDGEGVGAVGGAFVVSVDLGVLLAFWVCWVMWLGLVAGVVTGQ